MLTDNEKNTAGGYWFCWQTGRASLHYSYDWFTRGYICYRI